MSVQRFFVRNGFMFEKAHFNLPKHFDTCIYEVLRIINGVVLFAEDHLQRLFASLEAKGVMHTLSFSDVLNEINMLLKFNEFKEGNIRYDLYITKNNIDRWVYYFPHVYPSAEDYKNGVEVVSIRATRNEPTVKVYQKDLRKLVEQYLMQSNAYEAVLVDTEGHITEGSRSNIFFIKDNTIFTAPDEMVLAGITRKKVVEIIQLLGFTLIFQPVVYDQLSGYESVFLTGTSPKVLPIRSIDHHIFRVNHPLVESIMRAYDQTIESYIKSRKFE
ncbi:MAG: aminotransferase class IV [Bacteroidales bacterium]|nr:aminotransferase class IV [Bacteroidales bacterium]